MSKIIDKVFVEVTQTLTMNIEISEATGYDMPESVMEAHEMLNNIKECPDDYVCLNDKKYAEVETKLGHVEIQEIK
jgi:hypothetical protein